MAEEVVVKDVNHIHPLPDFVKGGLDFLPSDFLEDKERFIKTLSIFLERLKAVDEAMVTFSEMRTLSLAEGVNLDELGLQLGIFRNGLTDQEYRAVIMILSGTSAKNGTRGEVIGTLKQIFGDRGFTTWKGHNYRVDINITDSCFDVKNIMSEIVDMLPLPTHLRVVESEGQAFGFDGDPNSAGFASLNDIRHRGVGGIAALVYTSDTDQ